MEECSKRCGKKRTEEYLPSIVPGDDIRDFDWFRLSIKVDEILEEVYRLHEQRPCLLLSAVQGLNDPQQPRCP